MRLIIFILLVSFTTFCFSQQKIEKISELLEFCDFTSIGKSMLDGYRQVYGGEFKDNQELGKLINNWLSSGYIAMKDSMILIFDKHFTEKDIDDMLVFYNTRVGKKLTDLSPLLTELAVRAGKNWGEENKKILEEKIKPIIEKEKEKYSYESLYDPDEEFIKLDPFNYEVPKTSSSKYESLNFPFIISFNSLEWEIVDCQGLNSSADVCFQSIDQSSFSILIAEEVKVDLRQLKGVALSNMYNATKEVNINKVGLVNVNNIEALNMGIVARLNGIDIVYDNYYISSEWGILQMLTFCAKGDYEKSKTKMTNMNNGITLK